MDCTTPESAGYWREPKQINRFINSAHRLTHPHPVSTIDKDSYRIALPITGKLWGKVDMLEVFMREVKTKQQTATIKETAHELIDRLPDNAGWDQVLYTLQVRHDIEMGLADSKAGRVVTTEQLRKDLGLTD